ncbi:DUF6794 domain-containing protein [Elizabethkingia ursingii]|uniref:DUF6794 domain-containing protein n=1 Tax=Elizabethkingia ursingii TaxID=1756150 RepID=A0AAJ3NBM5_9FLAO|nr:DUF6794 domain-containing protein [Elizabethkingia ursingii]AQX09187.1 hypothetical protein BBD34_11280 [Elizabethkingia ursingii]OPB74444.1 hypothetical protein BAY32_08910 [Elizabethkingia ursingii]OPB93393.1 hypothetical protein BB021_03120 [Elizabethkingia ursingii]
MKKIYLIITFLFLQFLYSQSSAESVAISETLSSNGKFKLKSFSYDNEFPNLKGESFVTYTDEYDNNGKLKNFYRINRSFDLWGSGPFFVAISNDGKKVIYIKDEVYYKGEEHKNVTVYFDGKLTKTYTTEEFINCDRQKEKCEMFYDNKYQIFKGSSYTFSEYKDGATDKDKFLNKNFVLNKNDTIYVIDSRRKVTLFDLNNQKIIQTKIDFDSIYSKIKNIQILPSRISYYKYPYKYTTDIENIGDNEKLAQTISKMSNLKLVSINSPDYHKYKLYNIELSGYMNRNGKFDIDSISTDPIFDKQKIIDYISNTTFKTDFIPREVDKIYVHRFFDGYRSFDDKIAEQETLREKEKRKEDFKKRLTLDKIDDVYIPKNLYECNIELDKTLNFESKKKLAESTNSFEFNSHMGGLGMWIRNNWGINGGSRLLKYFHDRNIGKGVFGNDSISGTIIEEYIKWLKGDKTAWKKWERLNPIEEN